MPNYLTNDTELTSIANAIRAKTGGSSPIVYPNGFVSEIGNIPSGGGAVEEKQINFIDYDGTILHSYTKEEINAMSSESDLPANPSHTGLTAQGWNWTLVQLKAQLTAMPDAPVYVGQMYVTDDNKNRVYIHIVDKALCSMRLNFAVNGTVVVDWGDNTSTETVTGTSLTRRVQTGVHTYSSVGDYVITINVASGSMAFCSSADYGLISHQTATTATNNRAFNNMVSAIEIGSATRIGNYAFQSCSSLVTVTIPSSVTSIGDYAFSDCHFLGTVTIPSSVTSIGGHAFFNCYSLGTVTIPSNVTSIGTSAFSYCYSLDTVTIPSSVTSIGTSAFSYCTSLVTVTIPSNVTSTGNYAFQACYALNTVTIPSSVTGIGSYAFQTCTSLGSVTIPSSVTSIGSNAFQNCYSLGSVTVPSDVTSIGNNAFNSCYGLQEIHFKSTTPPAVSNSNAFGSLPTYCVIYVPTGSLSDYTSESNYPSSSTYTYVEE